jgi:hypothetical protein
MVCRFSIRDSLWLLSQATMLSETSFFFFFFFFFGCRFRDLIRYFLKLFFVSLRSDLLSSVSAVSALPL